ncbi:MAG TPA: GspH/FimT family pseudopilin [Steroidobacteraceae bacterium]|nr:GspH/FimT family pseudopilin [Steroidobacteraceae bacterium]
MYLTPFSSTQPHGAHRGFTLIELLMTMTVAGILAAIAVPSFNSFVLNNRDANQINSLVSSFNFARSEAVKRNTSFGVAVCPSGNGATCNAPAAGWSAGWIVLDLDPADLAPGNVLQTVPGLGGTNVLTPSGALANGGVTFNSTGGIRNTVLPFKIKICDIRNGAYGRDVEVNAVGNIASSQMPGQDANRGVLACP